MIDRATIDKIMDATNIVDVVGEFVTLRKAGVNYKGLCPFHDDKTPSFMVSPTKQICKCFACGEGGTAINFLMKHEQITYPEALRWLAKKYSIEIEEKELTAEEKQQQSDRESMLIVNEWAKDYYCRTLKESPEGLAIGKQYFRSRGIRDDIIEKFQLGYALPQRNALALAAQKAGYKAEYLVKTGLCYERGHGGAEARGNENTPAAEGNLAPPPPRTPAPPTLVDRYAGRVIFPWLNVSGRVVAFGGRLLDSRTKGVQQKYVNSPDSEVYHKERELYGLFQAKRAIAKEDRVYMVEGYTDVIAMHQAGVENVVANSGTALSLHQIKLLRRFTPNITLLYDGDEAGVHAAMRGTDMLLAEGMNVMVLLLPDGDDPDSFARKHSSQELKEYIEQHQTDFIEFKTDALLKGVDDPVKRSEGISSIVRSIAYIPESIKRDSFVTKCAHRLQVEEKVLVETMNKYIARDKEDREKERERNEAREQNQQPQADGGSEGTEEQRGEQSLIMPIGLHSLDEQTREVERLLVQSIVRHGGKTIYENIETEDGGTVNLTVAQYISYDLGQDNLAFHDPRYNQILAEATAHSGEAGFDSESYFLHHPDVDISNLATELAIDRHQLGRGFQLKEREGGLRQHVLHLVLDLRMDIVEKRLKEIKQQLRQVGSDMNRIQELLTEYKDTQELRDALARQLGNDLVR